MHGFSYIVGIKVQTEYHTSNMWVSSSNFKSMLVYRSKFLKSEGNATFFKGHSLLLKAFSRPEQCLFLHSRNRVDFCFIKEQGYAFKVKTISKMLLLKLNVNEVAWKNGYVLGSFATFISRCYLFDCSLVCIHVGVFSYKC